MLSQIPIDFEKIKKEDLDKEILRIGMMAELDAVNLYEQLAAHTQNSDLKKVLLDIAKETKEDVIKSKEKKSTMFEEGIDPLFE